MSEHWLSCKGTCFGSDPTRDIVKVNASQLTNKENVAPLGASNESKECEKAAEQGAQRWGELQEEAAKVQQQQREAREAAKAVEEERRRKLEEEERLRKVEEEEEAARKAAQEVQLREEARKEAEEAERLRREAEAAEAAKKAIEEEKEMKLAGQQVLEWCKSHGFQDVNVERKTFKGKKYPLHTAVKHLEPEMVKLLIKCGAMKDLKDSRGQTPLQLAHKLSKSGLGVPQAILDALQ